MKRKDLTSPLWRSFRHHVGLLFQAMKEFDRDHGFFLASGIAFNALIYLIPFTLLLLAMVGTLLHNDQVVYHIRGFFLNFAPSVDPAVMHNLFDLIENRSIAGILGIAGLVWVSTLVFTTLRTALNLVFHVQKGRSMLRGLGVDLMMILLVGILLLLSMILTSLITIIQEFGGRLPFAIPVVIGPSLEWFLKYLLPFGFTYLTFFLIYKIIPNVRTRTSSVLKAALFAGMGWEMAKHLFGWYAVHLSSYSVIYGSLSALIIFFFWVYYSSVILLVGGELAHILDRGEKLDLVDRRQHVQKGTSGFHRPEGQCGPTSREEVPAGSDYQRQDEAPRLP